LRLHCQFYLRPLHKSSFTQDLDSADSCVLALISDLSAIQETLSAHLPECTISYLLGSVPNFITHLLRQSLQKVIEFSETALYNMSRNIFSLQNFHGRRTDSKEYDTVLDYFELLFLSANDFLSEVEFRLGNKDLCFTRKELETALQLILQREGKDDKHQKYQEVWKRLDAMIPIS